MITIGTSARWLATVAAVVLSASPAAANRNHDKLDLALRQMLAKGTPAHERVIITVRADMRAALRQALVRHGDTVISEHPAISAMTAYVHGEDLEALVNDPAVTSVASDAEVRAFANSNGNANGSKARGALRALLGLQNTSLQGQGVGIAIVDSGIAPMTDFEGRIAAFYDFTKTGTPLPASPYDDFGHGTFVAGLAASSGISSNDEYGGVAPKARLIGLKVLDANGTGQTSHVIAAIDFAVANRAALKIDVINLSLGHPILQTAADDPLVQSVEHAVRTGIVVVVSAGNYGEIPGTGGAGYAGVTSPGNAPSAITVGSLRTRNTVERNDDVVALYSSRGPTWYDGFAKPDFVAPGDQVVSDIPRGSTLYSDLSALRISTAKGSYLTLSGTSMAAGVTSGTVAIVIEAARAKSFATPTPNFTKAILQYTAIPVPGGAGTTLDYLTQGTGGLNGIGAVAAVQSIDLNHTTGLWVSSVPPQYTTYGHESWAWAQNIVWGTDAVWSNNIVWSNNVVWANDVVWGSGALAVDGSNIVWSTLAGDNIVWGTGGVDNVVWGTASDWGDNIVWGTGLLTTVDGQNIVWSTFYAADNIVWGTLSSDNIVWGTMADDDDAAVGGNGSSSGNGQGDNIVWGTRSTNNGTR